MPLLTDAIPPMQLSPAFRELRGVGASDLLYVKEDIILPHSQSFYDLIVNQVRSQRVAMDAESTLCLGTS
jgi:XAP5, circadian clock regulator